MSDEQLTQLHDFLEREVVSLYGQFDKGHGIDHAHQVMAQAMQLAEFYPQLDRGILLTAAAYHDVGLAEGREHHHIASARIVRQDQRLRRWFSQSQIDLIADAAEDHRASNRHEPRTLYGRIIAEADRLIDAETITRRTIQYGLEHEPQFDREQHYERVCEHIGEKYAEGGYLKLWIPQSDNALRLQQFRQLFDNRQAFRQLFDKLYDQLVERAAKRHENEMKIVRNRLVKQVLADMGWKRPQQLSEEES